MMNRLNAALNFICTYEKVVTINHTTIDIIEEYSVEDNKVILYGYNNTYEFVFSNININVEDVHVNIEFFGEIGGLLCF